MAESFRSARLRFAPFALADAADVYACITPEVARFMRWDPPTSFEAFRARRLADPEVESGPDRTFVIRRDGTLDCLGVCAVERIAAPVPEVGLWLRADVHGQGFGYETVAALLAWAAAHLGCDAFDYPVAVANVASRRIAERLGGAVVARRTTPKYAALVYRIPAPAPGGRRLGEPERGEGDDGPRSEARPVSRPGVASRRTTPPGTRSA